MRYVIHCLDKPGSSAIRERNHPAHREHLGRVPGKILVAGPLVAEDSETAIGSLFIIEADSLAAVEAFNDSDPFKLAGLWSEIHVTAFAMRVDQR